MGKLRLLSRSEYDILRIEYEERSPEKSGRSPLFCLPGPFFSYLASALTQLAEFFEQSWIVSTGR